MKFGKLLGLVGVIGLLFLLWQVRQLLLLLYAAITFATVINQLVRQVQKLSVPRGWAVVLTLTTVFSLLSAAAWFVVPYIGPVLSLIPPMLMGIGISPWMGLAVLVLYFVIQQLESSVLTPIVMKQQVALLPAVALVAQVICAIFFGPLGLFLALPIVVVAQVWVKELLVKDILNNWTEPGLRLSAPDKNLSVTKQSAAENLPAEDSINAPVSSAVC